MLVLASGMLDGLKAFWILRENDNSVELKFEASPGVAHK